MFQWSIYFSQITKHQVLYSQLSFLFNHVPLAYTTLCWGLCLVSLLLT